jgi:hypothetical protein
LPGPDGLADGATDPADGLVEMTDGLAGTLADVADRLAGTLADITDGLAGTLAEKEMRNRAEAWVGFGSLAFRHLAVHRGLGLQDAHNGSHRRPRRRFANACVREYELFQRSNSMPPARPANAARPATPTTATRLPFLATAPSPLPFLATAPSPLPPLATAALALLAAARTPPFIDLFPTLPR